MPKKRCSGCKKRDCDGCLWQEHVVTDKNMLIEPSGKQNTSDEKGYGIAVDIGTTTIAVVLVDLSGHNGEKAIACSNSQRIYGTDIISRLSLALQGEKERRELQICLIQQLDEMAADLLYTNDIDVSDVKRVIVAGNTGMCELFCGIAPQLLSKAPFFPDYEDIIIREGSRFGFQFLSGTEIHVLPPIGGFVGADALCVYGALSQIKGQQTILAVDIGTNSEIILCTPKESLVCSAPAGPAFEGGAARFGMPAIEGAVAQVKSDGKSLHEDILLGTIEQKKPRGICGTGLLQLLCFLRSRNIVDETGLLRDRKVLEKEGVSGKLTRRITETEHGRGFLLTFEEPQLMLTAEDIRQLQLSISAVRSAVDVLLQEAGINEAQLDRVYLTGVFGGHISVTDLVNSGMLPAIQEERISCLPNLCSQGAQIAVKSPAFEKELLEVRNRIRHIELADHPYFQQQFPKNLKFPLLS